LFLLSIHNNTPPLDIHSRTTQGHIWGASRVRTKDVLHGFYFFALLLTHRISKSHAGLIIILYDVL
jgi:hypothetical protein